MATTSWFAYTLFLIFIGGLIILFIYITRLASNEKFTPTITTAALAVVVITLILTAGYHNQFFANPINITIIILPQLNIIFSKSVAVTTIIIITYLLVTLIIVVKISKKKEGPIRSTHKK